jgi:structural maintenance of chromosome 2
MKMKINAMMVVLLILSSGMVFAQKDGKMSSNQNREMKIDRLSKELDLTESQTSEMKMILTESETEMKVIKKKYPELKEAKAELKEVKTYKKEKLAGILSEEQLATMKSQKKGNEPEAGKHKKESRKAMKADLNLTENQEQELKTLNAEVKERKDVISKKYPQMEKAKSEMKELKKSTKSRLKEVLSEEQYQKFREIEKSKKGKKGPPKK